MVMTWCSGSSCLNLPDIVFASSRSLFVHYGVPAALLLKLEKRIAEVPIESKELGFTKDGPYIYELLSELNITQQTANMLTGIIEKACELLEEGISRGYPPLTAMIFLSISRVQVYNFATYMCSLPLSGLWSGNSVCYFCYCEQ